MSVAKPLQLGMWGNDSGRSVPTATIEAIVRGELTQAETLRRQAEEKRADAARWKPSAKIVSTIEGQEQVSKFSLSSHLEFALIEASLLSSGGVKVHDYPVLGSKVFSTGFSVPISHDSLLKIANSSQNYIQSDTFKAGIKYVVIRKSNGIEYEGVLPFHAQNVFVSNTLWFKLMG